jgi:hypothetical protein
MRQGVIVLSLLLFRAPQIAQSASPDATGAGVGHRQVAPDRASRWRSDIALFDRTLRAEQYDFGKRYDVTAFSGEIDALESNAGALTDAAITMRLMRLVASIHDGHSRVTLPLFAPFRRLPLSLEWYTDGLAVMAAAPDYSRALGARVVRMGSMTPDQVLAALSPYIAHENEFGLRAESPAYLTTVELLQHTGAAAADGRVTFTLAHADGTTFELSVGPLGPMKWTTVDALDALHAPMAVARSHPEQRFYWFQYLAESRAMYVRYDKCANEPDRPFAQIAEDMFRTADAQHVERWILDVRMNAGGMDSVIAPLVSGLKSRSVAPGHLFVLIGPHSFSAAIENALDLRRALRATLVGEPSGGAAPGGSGMASPRSRAARRGATSANRAAPSPSSPG